MKKLLLFILILSSCKKDEVQYIYVDKQANSDTTKKYIATVQQYTIGVSYIVKSKVNRYVASYSKFHGFDENGIEIMNWVTDTIADGDHEFNFNSVTSPFGRKYKYEIFITTGVVDSTLVSIKINEGIMVYRPNYGQSYNFASTWY